MKIYLTKFHYKKKYKFIDYMIYILLLVPSWIYSAITEVRNFLYKRNILKSTKPDLYVISVGNLTTGGTGKTPITAEIANYLTNNGRKVSILSRGYGGELNNKEVHVISDENGINYNAKEAGDEPFWLAKNCVKTAVLTCSSRVKAAEYAKNILSSDTVVLDDGFQHQKLIRDLNILVVDSEKKFSNGHVLPLGALRESKRNIQRADKIVVVNKNFDDKSAKIYVDELKNKYKKPVFLCNMKPEKIYNIETEEILPENTEMFAFCAIGQPEQFYNFLPQNYLCGTKNFPDHHIYTQEDIEILAKFNKILVTTEKDAVKLKTLDLKNINIYALKLKPELDIEGLLNEK